ncbi:glycerol kinase GlpK [Permianibacter sp. IMCC34836]|uniref:glycerol kinase GlpK n=1 Tax=Permianibacter fluminis TaxID=2738515 RepID=UPI0015575A64|nr:glycerol kinase GlpK [Permianibacter fluminis]NQD35965.1 glycerol kinase GlpK [Permianibacter fluminis]
MSRYLLALDQGTSSSRALLFNENAEPVALHAVPFACQFPQPGWVEQDANLLWQTQRDAVLGVLDKAKLSARDILAIGITNQRETVMAWHRDSGMPLHNAIVWQCRRTSAFCEQLKAQGHEPDVRARTGLVIDPYFSASKMRWLLNEVPAVKAAAATGKLCFGTVDSWLVWQLSKGRAHLTDASNAARTQLYNIHSGDWDPVLLKLFGIPRETLPSIVDCSGPLAMTDASIFGAAIPITGMAGDQQAALFGQACFTPGMSKNTYGTGCFMLMNTGDQIVTSKHGLLSTVAWQLHGKRTYALEGSVFVAGALIQWLRDNLGLFEHASDVEALARQVPDNGGVYIVPAFTGLGAPYWDADARGLICGLTRGTSKAHIARAALEAVAYQSADLLGAMEADVGMPLPELRIDGGMAVDDLLCQIQADVLQRKVTRPQVTESTARGAAMLAGLGAGLWQTTDQLAALWQAERSFEPQQTAAAMAPRLAGWASAVRRALPCKSDVSAGT